MTRCSGESAKTSGHDRAARAFAKRDLLVALALLAVVAAIIVPLRARDRALVRERLCESNLKTFGVAYASYAADFDDRIASFSWGPGRHNASELDGADDCAFAAAGNYCEAAADQAVAILRFRAGRRDMTSIRQWIPYMLYSHLVLNDYLQQQLPEPMVACPEDRRRLAWQKAVRSGGDEAFLALAERPAGSGNDARRWPYSSSYQLVPCAYSPDTRVVTPEKDIPTVCQSPTGHRWYLVGSDETVLGARRMSEVAFPGRKVRQYDTLGRHARRESFYAYDDVVQPMGMWDASVHTARSTEINPGFDPNQPWSDAPTLVKYAPELTWEPRCRNGEAFELLKGRQQWTREGLKGADLGAEIRSRAAPPGKTP